MSDSSPGNFHTNESVDNTVKSRGDSPLIPEEEITETRLNLRARTAEIFAAVKNDYQESDAKARKIATGLGAVALQVFDRLRASVVFVPIIAVDVFKETQSPTATALATGVTFAGWCAIVGASTAEGLYQYPKTVNKFGKNFPSVVNFFNESLPGFNQHEKNSSAFRRLGNGALTHIGRGFTVAGIGTTAYVATSVARGKPRNEAHKINLEASIDGGAAVGSVVFGIGQAILELADTNPELALRIQNEASNIKLWYGVAGALVIQQYIKNKIRSFKK